MRTTCVARHREHAEGIVGPQVRLGGEGEAPDILELSQIVGADARGVEAAAVVRHVLIGMARATISAAPSAAP